MRFYEDKGLLSPRRAGASRIFDCGDHARLSPAFRFKRPGFEFGETKGFLDLDTADGSGIAQFKMGYTTLERRISRSRKPMHDLEITLREFEELKADAVKRLVDAPRAGG